MWTPGWFQFAGEFLKICLKQNCCVSEHSVVVKSSQPFPSGSLENPCPDSAESATLQLSPRVTQKPLQAQPHFTNQWTVSEVWAGLRKHSKNGRRRESLGKAWVIVPVPGLPVPGFLDEDVKEHRRPLGTLSPRHITAWGCEALTLQCWPALMWLSSLVLSLFALFCIQFAFLWLTF